MGIIRLLLALSVVAAHLALVRSGISFFGTGVPAVESFFILSGFYMALVLRTKYRTQTRRFYLARLIRLIPIYWVLLFSSLVFSLAVLLVTHRAIGFLYSLQKPWPHGWLYPAAAFANVFIVGSDLLALYGNRSGLGEEHFLALPALWSLGTEMCFYALAPWVLRRGAAAILSAFLLFFGLRLVLWLPTHGGWTPWNYYFTPSAFNLFFLGALAYLAYERLPTSPRWQQGTRLVGWLAFGTVAANILFYRPWALFGLQDYRYYLLFAASLPFIFTVFRASAFDRAVGEYSYPLYLAHALVFSFTAPLRHAFTRHGIIVTGLAISFAACWVLIRIDGRISPWLHAALDQRGLTAPSPGASGSAGSARRHP